ncbi:unnamed protein product [Sympodiomycopsis kandeliae]
MSAAELASAGRTPAGGGNASSANQSGFSNGAQPSKVSPFGQSQNTGEQNPSPRGPPPMSGHGGPFTNLSRSGTPGGNQNLGRGGTQPSQRTGPPENYASHAPVLAAPRPVPPYPRFTSPHPSEGTARSPSPSKRSGPYTGFGGEGRERWASISQVQGGSSTLSNRSFDPPSQRHQSDRPPFPAHSAPGLGNSAQDSFMGYTDVFGPAGPSSGGGPSGNMYQVGREPRSAGFSGDRGFLTDAHREDHTPGAHGGPPYSARAGDAFNAYGTGQPLPNGLGHPFREHGALSPLPPSGSMSPRSMMQFHNNQMLAHQGAMQQPGSNGGGNMAHNLGSGLMSNSGQPAEEITTVFIVGFPDDMTERELANMFLFAKGFEASTLKVPAGGPTPGSGSLPSHQGAMGGPMAGPGGPYNAVNMPGANMFDMGSAGGWDEHSINMALSRAGSSDPFSLASLGSSLGGMGSMPGATGPNAGKIKQIIGFAKFRTRAEALEARDALNGKKVDAERGCVLKTEMAKKNLHTKQKPVLPGPGGVLEGPFGGPYAPQQSNMFHPGPSEREGPRQPAHPGPFPSSFPPSGGQSYESFSRGAGPPSSTLSGMMSPHGVDMQQGPDFLGRNHGWVGSEAPFGTVPARTPSEAPQSATSDKWASVGPLDYFGPENDSKRDDEYFRSQASSSATSHHSQPRGPDWSALGSPPGGLFSMSRSSGADASRSSGGGEATAGGNLTSPSKQGTASHSHHPPHHHNTNNSKEDFGWGEPMTITTPTISQGQSQRRDTRSTTSGGSFSGSPSKAATTTNSTTGSSSRASTSPPSANENHLLSQSSARMQEAKGASGMGSNDSTSQAGTAFASRFGTLRLETGDDKSKDITPSPETTSNRTSQQINHSSATSSSSSGGPRSPVDLPSPTSRSFSIDQNPPGNTLFVGNLPGNMSASTSSSLEESLRKRFSACSGYRQLSFRIKNNGTMCFVEFDDVQNAARALAEVNGDNMGGTVKNGGLRLSFSKNPLFRNSCSSGNATIGGSSTPTPSNTATGPANQQHFASLGKASEHLHKQPSASGPLSANAHSASTSHKSTGSASSKGVDPFDSINTLEDSAYKEGFSAGSSHGKLHGLFEGRQLGREKGFEIWDEVGFYEGTARFWKGVLAKQVESVPAHLRSRKQVKQLQHLSGLETLIAAFPLKNRSGAQLEPTPASMLADAGMTDAANGQSGVSASEGEMTAQDGDGLVEEENAEALAQLDMSTLLERIRARYKVVCASLGIPARGLEEGGDELVAESEGDGDSTLTGTSTPTTSVQQQNSAGNTNKANKTSALIGGKMVDTTQLRF